MILIGDPNIPYENIVRIKSKEDIKDTEPNSTVLFDFNGLSLEYARQNDIQSAVIVQSILESIYANSLGAKYIIVSKALAGEVQNLADHYMFDSRILAVIEEASEIEALAKEHIDGVIYKALLG